MKFRGDGSSSPTRLPCDARLPRGSRPRGYHRGGVTFVSSCIALTFDATHFVRKTRKDKEAGEPLWGKRTRSNYSEAGAAVTDQKSRPSYGSMVSFEAAKLDPEGSLLGFLDHVSMSLPRWSCYSMLLGRLRRNFKHVMLIDVKNWVVLSDPFVEVQDKNSETVVIWGETNSEDRKRHGRRKKDGVSDAA
ncbi:hypothetical protein MLD38_029679 [Melastoma candidum]|uniref:Uncharacterized protein n=1 Tax=Melastoma candidum TaxID=119954 RepID=A0ACB9N4V4_9MYRT|nr:hypothetical protein MLD38_029679 [Melastoma candidum]